MMSRFVKLRALLTVCATAMLFFTGADAADRQAGAFTILTLDGGIPYVSVIELAERFNVHLTYDPVLQRVTMSRAGETITVTHRSPTALLDTSAVNLVYPAELVQGALFVPAVTFIPAFSSLIQGTVRWDTHTGTLNASQAPATIVSIGREQREGGMLLRLSLSADAPYREVRDHSWLHIWLSGATIAPGLLDTGLNGDAVRSIRWYQGNGEARLSLELASESVATSITRNANPNELLISLRSPRQTASIPETVARPSTPLAPPSVNSDLWIIDTVVIDPGHGGRDPGAIGAAGTQEKNLVLSVARELKKIIDDKKEIRGVLTRDSDIFIPLNRRAEIANEENGKLFISIHANSHTNRTIRGMEIYFLSAAKTENAKEVAERENAVVQFEENPGFYAEHADILGRIQMDMASSVFLKESQSICNLVLSRGINATQLENRGVRQAGFYVMLGTQALMPSVLFEIGYISNPDEEKLLQRVSTQKRIAEAIYEAIMDFKHQAERDLISRSE